MCPTFFIRNSTNVGLFPLAPLNLSPPVGVGEQIRVQWKLRRYSYLVSLSLHWGQREIKIFISIVPADLAGGDNGNKF